MDTTRDLDDTGTPAAVGFAAMIGFAKAAFEGMFGLIGVFAAESVTDTWAGTVLAFAIVYAVASWLLWRGNKLGYWASAGLAALGLLGAVIYLFQATDASFAAALVSGGLNALVLYLLLGTKSARNYVGR
jgi:uncharacterized membrane protein (UPF0136 family)